MEREIDPVNDVTMATMTGGICKAIDYEKHAFTYQKR